MTIEEIAKLAKVSKSAVSLALNNKPGVSEATRDAILEIAKSNGYIPRVMVKADQVYDPIKAIRIVACIKQEVLHDGYQHEPFFSELISGLEAENRKQGYTLFFSSINTGDIAYEIITLEQELQSTGIIVIGTNLTREEVMEIHQAHPYTVIIDTCYPDCPGDFVVMNNILGAAQAAEYLIGMGHREIGYVESTVKIRNFDERKHSFVETLGNHGLSLSRDFTFRVNPIMDKAQQDFLRILKNQSRLPGALFCESDNIAIGILKALQKEGFQVPGDISVMGFDDIPHGNIVTPGLTTVKVAKDIMGSLAIKRLIEMVEGRENTAAPQKQIIDTSIVERESVASPSR